MSATPSLLLLMNELGWAYSSSGRKHTSNGRSVFFCRPLRVQYFSLMDTNVLHPRALNVQRLHDYPYLVVGGYSLRARSASLVRDIHAERRGPTEVYV